MLRSVTRLIGNVNPLGKSIRSLTHYPIDDALFGLTEEQIAVKNGL